MHTARIYATIEFVYNLARSCFHAVYGVFLIEQGLSIDRINLLRIIFFSAIIVLELPTGVLADRVGRALSAKLATLACGAGYAVYFLGTGFYAFAVAVVLTGIGFALYSGSIEAWAVDALADEKTDYPLEKLFARGKQAGTQGMIVGALLGAVIASVYMKGIWLLGLGGMLLTFVLLSFKVRDSEPVPGKKRGSALQLRQGIIVLPLFLVMLGIASLFYYFNQPNFLYWQIYFKQLLNLKTAAGVFDPNQPALGAVYLGMHQCTALGATLVPHMKGSLPLKLLLGGLLMGIPFLACGFFESVWIIGTAYGVSYLARGIFEPVFRTMLNQLINPAYRASLISLTTLVSRVGSIVALLTVGSLANRSLGQALAVAGLVFVIGLPIMMLIYRVTRKEDHASQR